jgi:tetratricopeptide (TPR) repeat protein
MDGESVERVEKQTRAGDAGGDDFSLGMAFYRTGMFDDALERFQRSVERQEEAERARFYIGMIRFHQKAWGDAADQFKKILEDRPDNIVLYNNLAVCFERMDLVREAELLYAEAEKISPLASQILANIGILRYRRGEYAEAREYLERAVHLNRGMAFAYFYLGMANLRLGRVEDARESLVQSLELSPDSPVVLNNLGILFRKSGAFLDALRSSLMALEVDDQLTGPYRNIDDVFCSLGEWEECQRLLDEAVPGTERRAGLLELLGDFYAGRNERDMAHQLWQRALEIAPGSEAIREKLAGLSSVDPGHA